MFKCISLTRRADLPLLQKGIDLFASQEAMKGKEVLLGCYTMEGDIPCEDFYRSVKKRWDLALVWTTGTGGMAVANEIRRINGEIPLIWICDDSTLAIHGYGLKVNMFLCAPVGEEEIAKALLECY